MWRRLGVRQEWRLLKTSFGRFRHENANRLSLLWSWAAGDFSQGDARPSLALGYLLCGPSALLKALK